MSPAKRLPTLEMARNELANHVMEESVSRAFRFSRPQGGSAYSFKLTWTPGTLVLSGDLGELTLTHYHAMPTFERALSWVATSNYSYLMEKSDKSKEYNAAETLADIIRFANDEPLHMLLGMRTLINGRLGWSHRGARREWQEWRCDVRLAEQTGEDAPEAPQNPFEIKTRESKDIAFQCNVLSSDSILDCDESWKLWLRIWHRLDGMVWRPGSCWPGPETIGTAAGRRALKKQIPGYLETPSDAAEFCSRIGLCDYYGAYEYNEQTIWQIEAIQHGCRMILASMAPAEAAEAAA